MTQGNSCHTSVSADSLTFTVTAQTFLDPSSGKQMVTASVFPADFHVRKGGNGERVRLWSAPKIDALLVGQSIKMGCILSLFTSAVAAFCV